MNEANTLVAIGAVLACAFYWPVIKASKEGPRYLLPGKPEVALTFALLCALLTFAALPASLFSDRLDWWAVLVSLFLAHWAADGPVWRFLNRTDQLPLLWLAGAAGCVLLILGYANAF